MRDIQLHSGLGQGNAQQSGNGLITPKLTIQQVVRSFISGFSVNSRITMKNALQQIADDLGMNSSHEPIDQLPWHTVQSTDLDNLRFVWEGRLAPSTIKLYMHALRGLARACMIHKLMSSEQYLLLRTVKVPTANNEVGRGRAVELKYRNALMKNCMDDERIQGVRDAAIFALLFGSGIRRAEAAGVLDENLNLDEGEVQVTSKGNKVVIRYIAAWAIPFLEAWSKVRRANGLRKGFFLNKVNKGGKVSEKGLSGSGIYYLMEERSVKADLPFLVKPHDARRTLGTEMIQDHGELIAQKVLGHSSLSTTKIYDKRAGTAIKNIFKNKTQ